MKRGASNLIVVVSLSLFLVIFIAGCGTIDDTASYNKTTPGLYKTIGIYIDEAPNDPDNLKKIHIADINIKQGELDLVVIKDVPEIARLKSALDEIKAKENLLLEYDDKVGDTYYLKTELIGPTDPRYAYALEGELVLTYGFRAEMR
ncbi:MAG: hypothetical protein Q8O89_07795 [Nanoarchaeota archaeon]|nr:hypothetical protein [Nanoarchaeota archaeon]